MGEEAPGETGAARDLAVADCGIFVYAFLPFLKHQYECPPATVLFTKAEVLLLLYLPFCLLYSPPPRRSSRSRSRSPARSYRERHENVENPGNNLYVTGLSIRVTEKDLEKYFAKVGEVIEARLVVDPRTRESRGFGFVTMSRVKDADRCIRHLHGSTLEGRIITVEKAKRRRARTPTPGQYLGVRSLRSTRYSQGRHGERGSYDDTRNGGSSRDSRSPYRNGPDSPYRGRSGYHHDSQDRHVGRGSYDDSPRDSRSPSPNARGSPYNRRSRYRHSHGTPSRSRSITPVYTKERR
ncbi:unnamed protein product [Sphagnum troendelagicum]|uniref:RRM domain-containing protein n=1 Tax=Sphagnum troendelagicum TaxID=128251 RepID=A0ABP0UNH7_9BRYO